MPFSAVDWGPSLLFLAAGLVLGAVFIWRVYASGRKGGLVPERPLELRDLIGKRDALLRQLRELEDASAKLEPAELARQRYALELEAARVLLALDERAAETAAAPTPAEAGEAAPSPRGFLAERPALRGFVWGVASVGALGLLLFLVSNAAKPRAVGGSPTGNPRPPAGEAGAAGNDQAEVQQIKDYVAQHPDDLDARMALVRADLARQDMMAVWNETQAVLKRSPGHPEALAYQALVRLSMGQADLARQMLEGVIAKDPGLLEARIHLALVYTRLGRLSDAEATMAEAERRFPEQKTMLEQLMTELRSETPEAPASGENPHANLPAPGAAEPMPAAAAPATAEPPAGEAHVSGTVDVEPSVKASLPPVSILFIYARGPGGGPPAAVKRLQVSSFPVSFTLSSADSMMGQPLPPHVAIEARVDSDGDPLTHDPQDPSARIDDVTVGKAEVHLVLKR